MEANREANIKSKQLKGMREARDKNKIKWALGGRQAFAIRLAKGGQGAIYVAKIAPADGDSTPKELKYEKSKDMVGKVGLKGTLAKEKNILQRLGKYGHSNIVKYLEEFTPKTGFKHEVLVLERASHGSLGEYWLKNYIVKDTAPPELEVWKWMIDCFKGLAFLHTGLIDDKTPSSWSPILHGDLKPDNILIDEDPDTRQLRALLTDFGTAQFHAFDYRDPAKTSFMAVTLKFMPNEYPIVQLGFDVYSIGASFHLMMSDFYPRANKMWYNEDKTNIFINADYTNREKVDAWALQPTVILPLHESYSVRNSTRNIYISNADTFTASYGYPNHQGAPESAFPRRGRALCYHLHRMLGRWDEEFNPNDYSLRLPAEQILKELLHDFALIEQAPAGEVYGGRDKDLTRCEMNLIPYRKKRGFVVPPRGYPAYPIKAPLNMNTVDPIARPGILAAIEAAKEEVAEKKRYKELMHKFLNYAGLKPGIREDPRVLQQLVGELDALDLPDYAMKDSMLRQIRQYACLSRAPPF